ncbi:cytochrome c oxidase subunit 2 [Aureimonas endophytica]|uniref:Cytochrome c oxidase subunit 2 n=1 Tax=Aureimonas endophytica TaxID=2027858 RepID=A0A917E8F9_9HYPH|nr:cytochrome c oxidase subunit II [Aureimonas endophytica]GGE14399.1 cytochrome c oxidase subunit 2 [Aureimonas endophytica]
MKRLSIAASSLFAAVTVAAAQELHPGQPHAWSVQLQEALSPTEAEIHWFSNYTLWFIVPIVILVAGLLAWCVWRFNERSNPVPSRTSHNTTIEVIWTLAPVLVLVCLAIPSFQLLTKQYNPPREPELTIKATGYQWYWGYEYQPGQTDPAATSGAPTVGPGAGTKEATTTSAAVQPVSFESYMLQDGDRAKAGKEDKAVYPRLLTVDNELVVPVDTVIRILSTSGDVIHSFAIPSMGVKIDAVPGRNNEYFFEPQKEGLFYGQCSELCGRDHAFMPIAVRVVSQEQFRAWLTAAASDLAGANRQLTASIKAATDNVAVAGR